MNPVEIVNKLIPIDLAKMERDLTPLRRTNCLNFTVDQMGFGLEKVAHLFSTHRWLSYQEYTLTLLEKQTQDLESGYAPLLKHLSRETVETVNKMLVSQLRVMRRICELIRAEAPLKVSEKEVTRVDRKLGSVILSLEKKEDEKGKERNFDVAVNRFFAELKDEGTEPLFVSGYVMHDGKGDYIHLLRILHKLRKKFPKRPLIAVIVSAEIHRGKLPSLNMENLELHLAYDQTEYYAAETEKVNFFPPEETAQILRKMKGAALWINGPIHIPNLFEAAEKKPAMMIIVEYDRDTNLEKGYQYRANMGLGVDAKGIFIKKKKGYRWEDLENPILKKELFQTTHPSPQAITEYTSTKELYLCYCGNIDFALSFIFNVVAFHQLHSPHKTIDICFPNKGDFEYLFVYFSWLSPEVVKKWSQKYLKGVGIIKGIYYQNSERKEKSVMLDPQGKTLRIFDVGTLSKRDFNRVAFLSGPLMACTGDNSLGIALSFGKIPQYENIKRELLIKLCLRAQELFGEASPLYQFFHSMLGSGLNSYLEKYEHHRSIIQSPVLIAQAKEFGSFVRENLAFDTYFVGWVHRILFSQENRSYPSLEGKMRQKYLSGELSLAEISHKPF